MKWAKKHSKIIIEIISYLFIILFVYAASSKLMDFQQFKIQLGQSPIVTTYAEGVAWGIPILELLIAGLFFLNKWILTAFYASFSLMLMFTTYIILVLNFSDFIPCSCGGVLEQLGWTEHIVFNLVFVAMSLVSILLIEKGKPQKNISS